MTESEPLFAEEYNVPEKLANSKHIGLLLASIYLAASIVFSTYVDSGVVMLIVLGQGYLIYFVIARWVDSTWNYLSDLQPIEAYDAIHGRLKDGQGYFEMTVQCYHYESSTTYNSRVDEQGVKRTESRTSTDKKVTYSTTQKVDVRECIDVSGKIASLDEAKALVFMQYELKVEHSDGSESAFLEKFAQFKRRNDRDTHQQSSFKFVLPALKEKVGYELRKLPDLENYKKWALVGMAYPFALQIEKSVARYKITLKKRVSV